MRLNAPGISNFLPHFTFSFGRLCGSVRNPPIEYPGRPLASYPTCAILERILKDLPWPVLQEALKKYEKL
jgi:hypothetical protein